jgi:hypothetical protein
MAIEVFEQKGMVPVELQFVDFAECESVFEHAVTSDFPDAGLRRLGPYVEVYGDGTPLRLSSGDFEAEFIISVGDRVHEIEQHIERRVRHGIENA